MADLGTFVAIEHGFSSSVSTLVEDAITTNILNSSVIGVQFVASVLIDEILLTKGERIPSVIEPIKPNYVENGELVIASIDMIVPGPIANISYGIRIGRDLERIEVPRVYPPIYINPRSRNA